MCIRYLRHSTLGPFLESGFREGWQLRNNELLSITIRRQHTYTHACTHLGRQVIVVGMVVSCIYNITSVIVTLDRITDGGENVRFENSE